MLDARKAAVLRKVVAEHIATGQPVGSAHVVRDPAIGVSPATARADMAALEREGYLTHPHTSAGRIPTDYGYRFFVDHLDDNVTLGPEREQQIREFFAAAHGELERMLRDTSQLLSKLTDYAAVVVAPVTETQTVRSALVVRLGERLALLVVVLSSGVVEKHTIDIDPETTDEELEAVTALLRGQLCGRTLRNLSDAAPGAKGAVGEVARRCQQVLAASHGPSIEPGEVYVGGTARMAEQFPTIDSVREVLSILEESLLVISLLQDVLAQGHSVSIGGENRVESLAECSLVVAPYALAGDVVGTIGVLGPTRMNYPQALAAVAQVSTQLSRQLSAGPSGEPSR